jgi:hypothetical protein
MPEIPDPQIDEIIADPGGYALRTYRLRYQEAKMWMEAEMARAAERYDEQRLGRRLLRALKSLASSGTKAA